MSDQRPESVEQSTDADRQAARATFKARRAAAKARHTPEYWAALRDRIGLPARTA